METLEAIAKRGSSRRYEKKPVSTEMVDMVVKAGCAAPIGYGDYEAFHLTIVESEDMIKKLPADKLYDAPVCVIVSAKVNEERKNINFADAGCLIENMMLAATDIGLGCVYLWGMIMMISGDEDLLKDLGIPEGYKPISGMALGHIGELKEAKELSVSISCNRI